MDVEHFIRTTIKMPGLFQVFRGDRYEDYIYISVDMVRRWGVNEFNWAIRRLHEIMQQVSVNVYLEAPRSRDGSYTLRARQVFKPCPHGKEGVCGNPELTGDKCPGEISDAFCFTCAHRVRQPLESWKGYCQRRRAENA